MAGNKDLINLKLIIEYDGKNYYGWQRQKSRKSIQQTIEESLQVLIPEEKIKLIGAGRTDSGVHAFNQAANFKIPKGSFQKVSINRLLYSLNAVLPYDIVIKKISRVNNDFHARYSAKSREYKYLLTAEKRAINADKYYFIKTKFDIDLAKEFCKLLVGIHSFRGFCKNKTDSRNFLCDVKYAVVKKLKDGTIEFSICANRFLHSMVRAIAGVMIKTASGKLSVKDIKSKLENGEDIKLQYLPANALFLVKVNY